MSPFGTITLGTLRKLIERLPADCGVRFDFGTLTPQGLASYRGYYDHLALAWSERGDCTAATLMRDIDSAHGQAFNGYKGGSYRMDVDTPVWASNWGEASGTRIVGVKVTRGADGQPYWATLTTESEGEDMSDAPRVPPDGGEGGPYFVLYSPGLTYNVVRRGVTDETVMYFITRGAATDEAERLNAAYRLGADHAASAFAGERKQLNEELSRARAALDDVLAGVGRDGL